jgi:hypothetical protein
MSSFESHQSRCLEMDAGDLLESRLEDLDGTVLPQHTCQAFD